MRSAFTLAALACVALAGVALSPAGTWQNPAPAQPAQIEADAQPYAPDVSGEWLLIVDRQGEPGQADVADYGLTLGDCFDAMRDAPRHLHPACVKDQG